MRGTYRDDEGELKPFLLSDGIGVGYGARANADGIDAVYFVAQENYPVEFLETRLSGPPAHATASCPIPAAPGRWRGGCGIVREYEILAEEAVLAVRIDSVKNPPWGIAGGMSGGTGRVVVNPGTTHERVLAPLSDGNVLKRGDILRIETGGGGGHGHPYDRPAETVLDDVLGGFVTADAARAHSMASSLGDGARRRGRHRRAARRRARLSRPSTARTMSMSLSDTIARRRRRYRRHLHRRRAATTPASGQVWRAKTPSVPSDPSGLPDRHPAGAGRGRARRRRRSARCCTARPSPPT